MYVKKNLVFCLFKNVVVSNILKNQVFLTDRLSVISFSLSVGSICPWQILVSCVEVTVSGSAPFCNFDQRTQLVYINRLVTSFVDTEQSQRCRLP